MGGPCLLVTSAGQRVLGPSVTDNFFIRAFSFRGALYHSVEHAFQALKFQQGSPLFTEISALKPADGETDKDFGLRVWRAGQQGERRADWETIKVQMMLDLVRARTRQHEDLCAQLLATGTVTIEGAPSTGWHHGGRAWNWGYFNGLSWGLCAPSWPVKRPCKRS